MIKVKEEQRLSIMGKGGKRDQSHDVELSNLFTKKNLVETYNDDAKYLLQ